MPEPTLEEKRKRAEDNAKERMTRRAVQTYTSAESHDHANALHVNHCSACGKLAFISKADVTKQPRRSTDQSYVVRTGLLAKVAMVEGEKKLIKREKGVEKQFRWSCTGEGCGLTLCYQSTPWVGDAKCIFVLTGALAVTATDGVGGAGELQAGTQKSLVSGANADKAIGDAVKNMLESAGGIDEPLNVVER